MPNPRDKQSPHENDEPVYMISVAARLCSLHPQTLRLYERLGLIRPRRLGSRKRLYSNADIERLQRIQHLTQGLGVNLAGVDIILRLLDRMERIHQEMEQLVHLTNARIRQLIEQFDLPIDPITFEIQLERTPEEEGPP